jgi:pyridoxal phosphate enzyme (YggS family)
LSNLSYIADNITEVHARIAQAAERAGRAPSSVRLVAVTKTVDTARVRAALEAGITDFGENYVQEARVKIPEVNAGQAMPPTWHLIGHLQSNKAKYSVELFSLIHSVENLALAEEIGRQASKRAKIQEILIEVNLTGSDARTGVSPDNALRLAEQVKAVPGIKLRGLMGMAPYSENAEETRPHFRTLRTLWGRLPEENRHELSMGMSNDFEIAVEEGATLVRIGTALFGARKV